MSRHHADAEAAERARALGAAAFTVGENVYFAAGRFRPDTMPGRSLIAHVLTHVLQQRREGARLQLAPDTPERQEKSATPSAASDLELPWSHGDYVLFEVTSGIRFLVALVAEQDKAVRTAIPVLAREIARDNARISIPARRVMTSGLRRFP